MICHCSSAATATMQGVVVAIDTITLVEEEVEVVVIQAEVVVEAEVKILVLGETDANFEAEVGRSLCTPVFHACFNR
jgi:hypothetical protein